MEFYTVNGWAGENYDSNLSTKDIASLLRVFVKRFKGYKFSITTTWNTITVNLYQGPTYPFEEANKKYEDVSFGNYNITDEYISIINEIRKLLNSYRYSDSDGSIDYFDTNFYYYVYVGSYNRPFKVK